MRTETARLPAAPGASWPRLLAAVALVWALSAAFTFIPGWHAHGLYLREAVLADGQWWRLATAMWVHLDGHHWLADMFAATGVMAICARAARARSLLLVLVACGFAVQVVLLRVTAIAWYGGLSGALHGLALWGALGLLRSPGLARVTGVLLCLGVLAKVWVEQSWLAPVVFDPAWGFGVVRAAHAAGAVAGLLCWVLQEWWLARRPARSNGAAA
ncbi:rhombosortase [Cupriavidus necator]|uniref:rhombosortase n=1 Tax=Cupriavidus necator TaxID=106590 RepID=UPI0027858EBA|nr:rhombosortase [Cupriavidus necator]MDQ0140251.1 rhomboid family GlyGly-CTERM serine protease [Cupriavidus necator]